jgi:hypothetical protein
MIRLIATFRDFFQIIMGVLCLFWVLSPEPKFRGGRPVAAGIRVMIGLLGLVMIGFGLFATLTR